MKDVSKTLISVSLSKQLLAVSFFEAMSWLGLFIIDHPHLVRRALGHNDGPRR
jgi:hypothetical protein